jgi:hypothetical protein
MDQVGAGEVLGRPMSASMARIRSSQRSWSAWLPWLQFSRKTSAPA